MRIYLSVDLEGIHGIVHSSQTQPGEPGYARATELMHLETNAVVEGLLAGGASEILVNDSHWSMLNLKTEMLHPKCKLISGWHKSHSMVTGVNDNFDAACFVGYHAKAGTAKGVLSHTYRAQVFLDVKLNNVSVGEAGLNAALAGWFGTPVALITGDDTVCKELSDLIGTIPHVAVKQSISRYAANLFPSSQILQQVKAKAEEALKNPKSWRLFKPPSPSTITLSFVDPCMADGAELLPIVKRISDRDIEISNSDYSKLFQTMLAIGAIGASRRDPYFS
jgi:D-amino peptidase